MKIILAFMLPLGLCLVSSCGSAVEPGEKNVVQAEAPANVFYVRTVPVVRNRLNEAIYVTGVIQSDTEAKPSFKTGGVIAQTYVKEGDAVRKGQLLGKLNMTEIEAQAMQARYALDKALRDQQRLQNLYADSIATLEQLQNATTGAELARKALQIAEFNVAYSEIRSPIAGKVITQLMHEGEITGPGMPVYYIMGVKSSDWKIVAGLTDKNWGRLSVGNKAIITLDAYPGWELEGTVKRLSDVANPLSGTFDVEIALPTKDRRMAAGLLGHVQLMPATVAEFQVIPIEALVSSNGTTGVVYVPRNGVAEKRRVKIQLFEGEQVAIGSGLEDVTEVITSGSGFLEEGDSIVIESENPKK